MCFLLQFNDIPYSNMAAQKLCDNGPQADEPAKQVELWLH